jgi:DNA-binding transcriptional LysR family regulator
MQGGQGRTYVPVELLRTVVTILDEGSFTKAGQTLGLTQSAISAQIKRLRQLVGDDVFARSGGGTKLTERGKIVERYARRILDMNDQLLSLSGGGPVAPLVRVGLPVTFAGDILVNAFKSCTGAAAKGMQVHLQCARSEELLKQLDTGFLDVAMVLVSPDKPVDLISEWSESIVWVRSQDLQLGPGMALPYVSWPDSETDRVAFDAMDRAGLRYVVSFAGKDFNARRAAVEAGLGFMLLPERGVTGRLKVAREGFLPELTPQRAGICVREGFDREAFTPLLKAFEAAVRPAEREIAKICGGKS